MQYKIKTCLWFLMWLLWAGCSELEAPVLEPPTLSANAAADVTRFSVTLSGGIKLSGSSTVKEYGLAYSIVSSMAEENTERVRISYDSSQSTYEVKLTGLTPGTPYFYRFYATNGYTEVYSEKLSFTTKADDVPMLDAVTLLSAAESSMEVKSSFIDEGGSTIQQYGFAYKKVGSSTEEKQVKASNKNGSGVFSLVISDLDHSSDYEVRAYAVNSKGTGYSEAITVSTSVPVTPEVKLTATASSHKMVTLSGSILNADLANGVTEVGFYWGTESTDLEQKGQHIIAKLEDDYTFKADLTELTQNTTYYAKAYAINKSVTGYSEVVNATTATPKAPVLKLTAVADSHESISLTANVQNLTETDGITEVGFYYSKNPNEVESQGEQVIAKLENDVFKTTLVGLEQNTTYYIKAYGINNTVIGYSDMANATTARSDKPTLDKVTISNITESGATLTGKVLDTGNNNLTDIGFCYKTADGNEMQVSVSLTDLGNDNTFQVVLNGLSASTNYQVRAYATNKEGTGYSNEYTIFKTMNMVSPILTVNSSDVTAESLVLSAVIQSIGKEGETLGEVGFCWSTTNKTPSLSDNVKKVTANGMYFGVTLEGLKSETTYYIRAFATNESTVGYSGVITVKTLVLGRPDIDDNPSPEL